MFLKLKIFNSLLCGSFDYIFIRTTNSYNLNCLLCVEMILRANTNDDDDTRIHEQKNLFVRLGLLCGKPT